MFLYRLTFGRIPRYREEEADKVADEYLRALFWGGQTGDDYFLVVEKGKLTAYVDVPGRQAIQQKYLTEHGRMALREAKSLFGKPPAWECRDDEVPKKETTWKGAPFLFLHTRIREPYDALYRGDNAKAVPLYRLGEEGLRSEIVRWHREYREYDAVWMNCGPLEIPAYKLMVDPFSELSELGRDNCRWVEKVTSIPTYYFLPRYWGRKHDEEKRRCPGCGGKWRSSYPPNPDDYWNFPFKCDRCRLVSEMAHLYDEQRYAHIGEWKGKQRKRKSP